MHSFGFLYDLIGVMFGFHCTMFKISILLLGLHAKDIKWIIRITYSNLPFPYFELVWTCLNLNFCWFVGQYSHYANIVIIVKWEHYTFYIRKPHFQLTINKTRMILIHGTKCRTKHNVKWVIAANKSTNISGHTNCD